MCGSIWDFSGAFEVECRGFSGHSLCRAYNMVCRAYRMLCRAYNMLYRAYNILCRAYSILWRAYNMLCRAYNITGASKQANEGPQRQPAQSGLKVAVNEKRVVAEVALPGFNQTPSSGGWFTMGSNILLDLQSPICLMSKLANTTNMMNYSVSHNLW